MPVCDCPYWAYEQSGREQVQSIVGLKILEQAERANKRSKRAFEMSQ